MCSCVVDHGQRIPIDVPRTPCRHACVGVLVACGSLLQCLVPTCRDHPSIGTNVNEQEVGYLYGQYKRINVHHTNKGLGLLWGGMIPFKQAYGFGVVHFAETLLNGKKDSLKGKRCLITGSGKLALAVAEKLLEYGAIPLTFSDETGYIYEQSGMNSGRLQTIQQIKSERGARIGRYIVTSTTAK